MAAAEEELNCDEIENRHSTKEYIGFMFVSKRCVKKSNHKKKQKKKKKELAVILVVEAERIWKNPCTKA